MIIKPWKLYLDLIPHKYFHKGYWLGAKEPNPWYYFFPVNRPFHLPKDDSFYKTLDKELVKLVKHLHVNNIPTTPSCAGHFSDSGYYSEVYDRIVRQVDQINQSGILLNNPETGKDYFYRNIHHKLPWDKNTFINRSLEYQKKGVLGIVDKFGQVHKILAPTSNVDHDNGITLVYVDSNNPEEKQEKWHAVSNLITKHIN